MRRIALSVLVVAFGAFSSAQPAGAIVGGEEADEGEWPWQVALLQDGGIVCGGSLLALDVVLTAAHCIDGVDAGDLAVRAGIIDVDDGGQELDVARVEEHEDYDSASQENDIAVLRLDGAFEAGDDVSAVALPDAATAEALAEDGSTAVVTGFGTTSERGDLSDVLLEGEIRLIDDETCTERYAGVGDEIFGASQVCAGLDDGRVDACFGDSGGPLVVPADDERSGWYLIGLVSFGEGCGRPLRPTVYTEVAAFAGWLDEQGVLAADGERFDAASRLRLPAIGTRGKASRYPSVVEVRDAPDPLTGVSVELQGLTHGRPTDLDIWLEAPDGTVVTLLSDVGSDAPVEAIDVVISAGGPAAGDHPLPRLVAPTDRQADGQRHGARPLADLDPLSGLDPEGDWHLLVADDRAGASGSLEGWTLVLR